MKSERVRRLTRRVMIGIVILAVLAISLPLTIALAQPVQPERSTAATVLSPLRSFPPTDLWEALHTSIDGMFDSTRIEIAKFFTTLMWWFEKMVARISEFIMSNSLWQTIWNGVFSVIKNVAPTVLRGLVFGMGGALYLAIMMAGISLIFPEAKLARPDRAIIWGVLVAVLFISGSVGFDLINSFEQMRTGIPQSVMAAANPSAGISTLVAQPMTATSDEVLINPDLVLPAAFAANYFPPPIYESVMISYIFIARMDINFRLEDPADTTSRLEKSEQGLSMAVLNLAPMLVTLLFGIAFAALAAAAIVLIIFFIAATPIGFFEFGAPLLKNIGRQYLYLFAMTLLVSFLAATMLALSVSTFPPGGVVSPAGMIAYLPVLLVIGFAMRYAVTMTFNALAGSLKLAREGVSTVTSMSSNSLMAQQTAIDQLPGRAGTALATMGVSALTNQGASFGTGLAAGAGALVAGTAFGNQVGRIARSVAPDSDRVDAFQTATANRGLRQTAAAMVANNLRQANSREQGWQSGTSQTARRTVPRWAAADAGAFLTTDLTHLDQAERSFFERKDEFGTHQALERAFGSTEVADDVLDIYRSKGRTGAKAVRTTAEVSQATALEWAQSGDTLFDSNGNLTPGFQTQVRQRLKSGHVGAFADRDEAEVMGRVAGSVVRTPQEIWSDPAAPQKLAKHTLTPGSAGPVSIGDTSAAAALKSLAVRHNLEEPVLTELYTAARAGRALAFADEETTPEAETLAALDDSPRFNHVPRGDRKEMARLATLVTDSAQVQQPGLVNLSPGQASPLAFNFNASDYNAALDAYYDDGDEATAEQKLVAATGSRRAADEMLMFFGRQPKEIAAAVPRFLDKSVVPQYDEYGQPSPDYLQDLKVSGRASIQESVAFDEVAPSLLTPIPDDRLENVDRTAAQILTRGDQIGEASAEVRRVAHDRMWSEQDVARVLTGSVNGLVPNDLVGDLPEVERTNLLASARDALIFEAGTAPEAEEFKPSPVSASTPPALSARETLLNPKIQAQVDAPPPSEAAPPPPDWWQDVLNGPTIEGQMVDQSTGTASMPATPSDRQASTPAAPARPAVAATMTPASAAQPPRREKDDGLPEPTEPLAETGQQPAVAPSLPASDEAGVRAALKASPLTPAEQQVAAALMRPAVSGGAQGTFDSEQIFSAVGGSVSRKEIEQIGQRWTSDGWLRSGADGKLLTTPQMLTDLNLTSERDEPARHDAQLERNDKEAARQSPAKSETEVHDTASAAMRSTAQPAPASQDTPVIVQSDRSRQTAPRLDLEIGDRRNEQEERDSRDRLTVGPLTTATEAEVVASVLGQTDDQGAPARSTPPAPKAPAPVQPTVPIPAPLEPNLTAAQAAAVDKAETDQQTVATPSTVPAKPQPPAPDPLPVKPPKPATPRPKNRG